MENNGTNIAVLEHKAVAVSLMPVTQMLPVLAEYTARRNSFREWLLSQLVEGTHYGIPPGCEPRYTEDGLQIVEGKVLNPKQWKVKPSLYKAGADFICDLLMLDPKWEPDLDAWKMAGAKDGTFIMRCTLRCRGESPFFPGRAGEIIGEGRGAGIAGVKRRDANGAIKISQKSSKIDAVINSLGISDLFSQDLDDLPPRQPTAEPDYAAPVVGTRQERATGVPTVSADDLNELFKAWSKKSGGKTKADFCSWCQHVLTTELPMNALHHWSIDALSTCREAL